MSSISSASEPSGERYEVVSSNRNSALNTEIGKKTNDSNLPLPSHPTNDPPLPKTRSNAPASRQNEFDLNFDQGNEILETLINIDDRDELGIAKGLNARFPEIYAEPEYGQTRSIACVWTNSFRVFEITRTYTYKILSLILGIPLAFIFGLIYAFSIFMIIWVVRPSLRLGRMMLAMALTGIQYIAIYGIRPVFYAFGAVFSTARLHTSSGEQVKEPWMPQV